MRIFGGADNHDEANWLIFAFFVANTPEECHRMAYRSGNLEAGYVVSGALTSMLLASVDIL
jgi:hypothetical protein